MNEITTPKRNKRTISSICNEDEDENITPKRNKEKYPIVTVLIPHGKNELPDSQTPKQIVTPPAIR